MFSHLKQQDKNQKQIEIKKKRSKKNSQQKAQKSNNFQVMSFEQILEKKKQKQILKQQQLKKKKKGSLTKPKKKTIFLSHGDNKKMRTNTYKKGSSRLKPAPFTRKLTTTAGTSTGTTTTTTTPQKTKTPTKTTAINQIPNSNTRKRNFQQIQLMNSKQPHLQAIKKITDKKQQIQEEATYHVSLGETISLSNNQKMKLSTNKEIKEFLNFLINGESVIEGNNNGMTIEKTQKKSPEVENYKPFFSLTDLQDLDQQFEQIEKRIHKMIEEYQLDIQIESDYSIPSIEELDNYEKQLQQIL
ncbi:hypothetical protein M0813_18382 [Anaeramoeba flamelloides]|uniref:Uncharacterized protein n=1 Tax=Anaeramoeba flamelloides TaxID=1746091 RepID=A0ABQ8YT04_9EUKA|nr:hypothetical protein M0813_18382 [Anaeramoeba flamelloides]